MSSLDIKGKAIFATNICDIQDIDKQYILMQV